MSVNPLEKLDVNYKGKVILRLWDMFDGWMDLSREIDIDHAVTLWNQKTCNGTRNVKYDDGDYYAIFPAGTKMVYTPEFLGR